MKHTQAIVLKREDFRERDESICLYTKDFGKITVVAKGVKRIEAKLRGNLDIFNFVDIIFVEGAGFPILTAVEMRERFSRLTHVQSLYKVSLGIAVIISDIFGERIRDEKFFDILHNTFKNLNSCVRIEEARSPSLRLDVSGRAKTDLYSWLLFKKFQLAVLEDQGYGAEHSPNLLQKNFKETEDFFTRAFAYHFNYKPYSWIPK